MGDKIQVVKKEKTTPEEVLTIFFNGHLKEYLAARIRLQVCQDSDPNDVVGQRQIPPLGPNQAPGVIDIKAKEMEKNEVTTCEMQAKFLRAVEKKFEEIKKDPTPWRQK